LKIARAASTRSGTKGGLQYAPPDPLLVKTGQVLPGRRPFRAEAAGSAVQADHGPADTLLKITEVAKVYRDTVLTQNSRSLRMNNQGTPA